MAKPATAVALFRRRRTAWADGDSARAAGPRTATGRGSSLSLSDPPLMGRMMSLSSGWLMASSGVPDPGVQERVREVHEEVDDDEGQRGDEGEALDLLVITRD